MATATPIAHHLSLLPPLSQSTRPPPSSFALPPPPQPLLPTANLRCHRKWHALPSSTPRCSPPVMLASVDSSSSVQTAQDVQPLSPEEEDQENIRQILSVLELLRTKRDMTFNEVRLTIMIEDPREVERREQFGIEDERGCSREEMAAALLDVYEGRIPSDRLVLRELAKELLAWPKLEDQAERTSPLQSPYARATDTGVDPALAARRAKLDWDAAAEIEPGEEAKDIGEILPPAVGFSVLYLFSAIPIFIGVAVVAILFFNSLQ